MNDTLKDKLDILQKLAKERTVKTQSMEYDLETLVKKINKGIIKLNPDYQRNHRWKDNTSSKLIESLILNIPIPTIYMSQDIDVDEDVEDDIPRYSVIDGQQRLTAITNYMSNKLILIELEVLEDLNGCYYKDLPPFLIRRLEERTIKCLRIDSTVDPQVKYDIFERLNSGSVELTAQELRNAIYRGKFNNMIKELATDEKFRALLNIDEKDTDENNKVKKMEDVELVLRFFVLDNDNYYNLKKGFKKFLSDEMEKFNDYTEEQLSIMKDRFKKTMKIIYNSFGNLAFAKYKYENRNYVKMSNFNAAVYDALSIAVVMTIDLDGKIEQLKIDKFKALFSDNTFFESVSGSVNDKKKVETRIEKAKEIFR
jgi:hypothetical protein